MIKLLINLISLVLCGAIIFFGGAKTVENSKPAVGEFIADVQIALQEEPVVEDGETDAGDGETDAGDNEDSGSEDTENGGSTEEDTETGGSTETPDAPTDDTETPSTTTQTAETIKGMIDSYNPAVAETTQNMMTETIKSVIPEGDNKETITDAIDTYFENLYTAIEEKKTETDAMEDTEAAEQAKTEFAEKESAALNGVVTIVNSASSGEVDSETITESVDAILDSEVCLETVTTTITDDEKMSEDIKNATSTMDEETKATIESSIQQKLEENPENEEQYKALADLFGIQLNGSSNSTEN